MSAILSMVMEASTNAQDERMALDDLRYYLRQWRRWLRAWRPNLGYPHSANFVSQMIPVVAEDEDDAEQVDPFIMQSIDAEIANLPKLSQVAVRLVYLREIPGMATITNNRLPLADARKVAESAERELLPKLRKRGVVLGGK